jgi:hypothetical protein
VLSEGVERELATLAAEITAHPGWWIFPSEKVVRGFMGTAPVFLVGDQPSTSDWPETNPNRRLFYDTLTKVGLADAHLTDVYKQRGAASAMRHHRPADLQEHIVILRREIELLRPRRIIGMGDLAHELLWGSLPECRPIIRSVRHFAYVTRWSGTKREELLKEWETDLRSAADPLVV